MKNLLLSIIVASSMASAAHAGIGDTYRQSNNRYESAGRWHGDHADWNYCGYLITEGFDSRGLCDLLLVTHTDCTDLTYNEARSFLFHILPDGYTWKAYNGNAYAPTWSLSYRGINWYAMYFTNTATTFAGVTVYVKSLRVGTENALASRGLMNGPAPRRYAGNVSRPAPRKRSSAPARVEPSNPSPSLSEI
jgi:hypothetical protein